MRLRAIHKLWERGRQVAALLAGAWRANPPPLPPDANTLAAAVPHLVKTGAAALAWWKLRGLDAAAVPALDPLHEEYQLHRREAFLHEIQLVETFAALHQHGIEPLLGKGWGVARHYPEAGLRPYGDFDLHFHPEQFPRAVAVLSTMPRLCRWVDVHCSVPELPDRPFHELFARAQVVPIGDTVVRTLGAEDQFRFVCLHFARHGGWRPLWLCDVAALLEAIPAGFDWDYCLSGDARLTAWASAVIGLAGRLLGARSTVAVPESSWLDRVILSEWGRMDAGDSLSRDRTPLVHYLARLRHLPRFWPALRQRVPNRVEAAFKMGAFPAEERGGPGRLSYLRYCFRFFSSCTLTVTRRLLRLEGSAETGVNVHVPVTANL